MEITYELTEEDYIKFNLYHISNSPSQRKVFQFSRFGIPVIMGVVIYLVGTQLFDQSPIFWLINAAIFALIWVFAYPNMFQNSIIKQVQKMVREGDNSQLYGKKTMKVEGDQLTIVEGDATTVLTKDSIKKVQAYDDMILLYLSSVSAHIIPTRYLTTEGIRFLLEEFKVKPTA